MANLKRIENFIGGKRVPSQSAYMPSYNPALGQVHFELPVSNADDVEQAVSAASAAFKSWSQTDVRERSKILMRVADLIDARVDEFAAAESSDQGKPVWLAREMDIPRAALNFRFFASSILHQTDIASRLDLTTLSHVSHDPVGVAGLISPWNLPLYLLTWKIAPAIAYGNTCVAKPSELTSLTASLLCDVLNEAGVPAGVVNIVFGLGSTAGAALVAHPNVPLVSFTGGTVTGRAIAGVAAPMFKKLSLELGGKNPNIIFDDASLKHAVATTVRSSFLNQGEICLCGSRIYVQASVYEKFLESFSAKVRALKVGDPTKLDTFVGALVSREHLDKVYSFVDHARSEGAVIQAGGEKPALSGAHANGYFMEPTIITGLKSSSRVQQEEIFGPVVTVTPFETEDEAIELANGTRYGLSATVWTQGLRRSQSVSERLHAGTVWVNNWMSRDLRVPFGGVKESGVGREGQDGSREFFTEAKTICVRSL